MTHGFTLLEVLAVCVLLGLMAIVGTSSVSRPHESDDTLDAAIVSLQEADGHSRFEALGRGGRLNLAGDGLRSDTPGMLPKPLLTSDVWLEWSSDGAPTSHIDLDARGRSVDLLISVHSAHGSRRFLISGLTGCWIDADGATLP